MNTDLNHAIKKCRDILAEDAPASFCVRNW